MMGQTQSREGHTGTSTHLQDGDNAPASNHNNATMAKGLKYKLAKEPADANPTKRKRNPSVNGNGRRSTIWTPSPAESEEEQDQNPPKRQRAVEMGPKSNGLHETNGKASETNSTASAVVDPPAPQNSERPKTSPKQQKESPAKPKQNNATRPATQTKSRQPKGSRQPPTPSTPSKGTPTKSRRRSSQGLSEKSKKLTGFFTESEVATLESFKLSFCSEHGLSGDTFDLMVQHSDRGKGSISPFNAHVIRKEDFWRTIYEIIPSRDRRSIYRFMRRHFQASTQKPHQWSEQQDEELISLHAQYGPKFAFIADLLGRSSDDVVQRWKNKLEHRNTMRRGQWSYQEICGLLNAVQSAYDTMAKAGTDVGKDIYTMDDALIGYGIVSDKMQNCRSRQQCGDKWRKIRRGVLKQRASGNPGAVCDPSLEANAYRQGGKGQKRRPLPSQYKSSEYVDDGDEAGEGGNDAPKRQPQLNGRKSSGAALQSAKPPSPKSADTKPASSDKYESQSDSQSGSDADSESESDSSDGPDPQPESESRPENPKTRPGAVPLTDEILDANPKLVNGDKPKGSEEANNAPTSTATQEQDTAAPKRNPSPASSLSSTSESGSESGSGSDAESEESDSKSHSPAPVTETTTKPTTDRKEAPNSNDKEDEDGLSDNSSNESSSEDSESDEEDEDTPSEEQVESKPEPKPRLSNQAPQSTTTIKRKPSTESKENTRPSLKRMKLEMTKNENKPAEQSTPKRKEVESASSSDSESRSSEDDSEDDSESESDVASERERI